MQSPAPSGSGAPPPITLSTVEKNAFGYLFNLADPERTGIVTGDAAVPFFAKSKLPPATLAQIWGMADSANNGFLTAQSFSVALRLIGHAQRGEAITEASIKRPGPPPTMEGISLPVAAQLTGSQPAAALNMPGVIEIKPEDRARYTRIFANSGPVGGLIDGDRAKEIFVKSKLPFDKLGAIWNLADTQARGALDLTDFIIAMHFIQNTMNGSLNSIPAALPPGLYEQAKGSGGIGSRVLPGSPIAAQNTGGSASGFGSFSPQRQMSVNTFPTPSAFQSSQLSTPAKPAATSAPWDVTPDEKSRADQFFDGLDVSKQGKLDGPAVVPFFMQSKLTETVLAQIWDLSDITQSGTLSKDEFAVAMHLINAQLAGKPLPQQLPASLVPPSMRSMDLPAAVNPQQSDTQKDLFSLMDDDPPAPAISASSAFISPSPAAPVVSSAQITSPIATSTPASAPFAPTTRSAPGPFDDDFFAGDGAMSTPVTSQPAQSFPAALSPAATGGSFNSAAGFKSPVVASPTASTSRLGTAFAAGGAVAGVAGAAGAASTLGGTSDQGAEFGNKSIQLQSTEKAVSDLQAKRGTLESSVATNTSTIAELESRLATVRGQHETESKLVKDLEERQQKQSAELKTLREDVIREESELSALKAEKDELEQALMRDREDVRDMKKRMNDVQMETKNLKEQLEKLRKDARQQKGLVAISKKQLATAEAEQDKTAGEIEAVQRCEVAEEAAATTQHHDATVAAPAHTSTAAETVTSPAASVRSTNPFDRFGSGAASSPAPGTPSLGTSLAAGAGAGAVLGGVVDAAAHHGEGTESHQAGTTREADPFAVQHSESQQQHHEAQSLGFDVAFAVPGETASTAADQGHTQTVSTDFDDNFGDDFGASATAIPVSSAEPQTGSGHHGTELAAAGGLGAAAAVGAGAAVHAVEPSHTAAAAEVTTGAKPEENAEGPFGGDAPPETDMNRPDAPDADEDSSDDEDDGPEDLDGYKHRSTDAVAPAAGAATSASAADRFPEIDSTGEDKAASTSVAPTTNADERTVPGGLGDVTTATATAVPAASAPVDPSAIGAVEGGRTASTTSIAPVSRQETLDGDAIPTEPPSEPSSTKDAAGGHAGAGAAAAGGLGVAALAAGAGALTLGERGHADAAVTSPTDDIPLSQLMGAKGDATAAANAGAEPASVSPSASIKTRRAPPPAPVRSTTAASSALAAPPTAPAVLAAEPTTAAPVQPVGASTNPFGADDLSAGTTQAAKSGGAHDSGSGSNFDDFDSAFEDLGPSEAVPSASAAGVGVGAGAGSGGFDDAFDNDFDFVPSFSAPGASAPATAAAATAAAPAAPKDAFDDFDAAFDSQGVASKSVPPPQQQPQQQGQGSGFSFEDAFDPTPSSSSTTAAVATGGSATSPIVPVGSYAPPPGPPPGFTSPAPPAVPPRSGARTGGGGGNAIEEAKDYTGALPDDAAQVKQLCGMGFTRENVIQALEKSNYRTEKALERLLASA